MELWVALGVGGVLGVIATLVWFLVFDPVGRKVANMDVAAREALVDIVEKLGDQNLSSLGMAIRDRALKGLRGDR